MATDIFILSSESESWEAITKDLAGYLASQANGRNVGFHEGNNLNLKSGEFFRGIGVPDHSLWQVEDILQWCSARGRATGRICDGVFQSSLGTFGGNQFEEREP